MRWRRYKDKSLPAVVVAASHAAKNVANRKQRHEMAPLQRQKPPRVETDSAMRWRRYKGREPATHCETAVRGVQFRQERFQAEGGIA